MSENPDCCDYIGLGPQSKKHNMDTRYLIPTPGMLRYVDGTIDNHGTPAKARLLQQYQWSAKEGDFGWYEIPLVEDDS
jgi:hypothetical protein